MWAKCTNYSVTWAGPPREADYKNTNKLLTSYVPLLNPTRHAHTNTHLPIHLLYLATHTELL